MAWKGPWPRLRQYLVPGVAVVGVRAKGLNLARGRTVREALEDPGMQTELWCRDPETDEDRVVHVDEQGHAYFHRPAPGDVPRGSEPWLGSLMAHVIHPGAAVSVQSPGGPVLPAIVHGGGYLWLADGRSLVPGAEHRVERNGRRLVWDEGLYAWLDPPE